MKKRILIVKRADMEFDIRCQRLAKYLSTKYDVTILATEICSHLSVQQIKISDYDHVKMSIPGRALRKFRREIFLKNIEDKPFDLRLSKDKWISNLVKYLNRNQFEVILACDIDSIAAVLRSRNPAKLIGDMHEHAPTELANVPNWLNRVGMYKRWQCETFLPHVQEIFTVSKSLANLYESEFKVSNLKILRNVAPYEQRVKPGSSESPKNFIHHGIAAPVRGLEEHAILAKALGPDYSISMLLKPVEFTYYRELKAMQKYVDNFHILDPVQPKDMIREITRFDAGIYLLNPMTSQLRVTLPNKFFEFVQARLPVFSGGLAEIDELISAYGVGMKLGTFDGIKASEMIVDSKDYDWKVIHENLDVAAKELSLEIEFKKISRAIEELF
jgi:hypothetical protein